MISDFVVHLGKELSGKLPGIAAQKRMAPSVGRKYYSTAPDATLAAVLILLYPLHDKLHFALMKRKSIKGDTHSGQVSLPGGRMDNQDFDLINTALRETEEELGIIKEEVQVIGKLTDLYVFASNHLVAPYVGYVPVQPDFTIDPREVDWLIEVDIPYLLSPVSIKTTNLEVRGYTLREVPYFDIANEIVWGATAMMISEFLEVVKKVYE